MRLQEQDPAMPKERFVLHQPADPVLVNVERRRIEQVLTNLLENAVKYSPADRPITITTEVDAGWAQVEIVDQGIGIPEQDVSRLFTPFFRASNAPELNYGGLGLGLYFSRAVIEVHGGQLTIQSVEDQSTACTMTLPLAPDAHEICGTNPDMLPNKSRHMPE